MSADEDDFGFKVDFKLSAIEQAYIRGANLKISKTVNRNSKGRVMRSMTNITGSKTVKNVNHQNIQQTSSAGIKKGSPLRQLIGLPSKELNTNQEPIVQTKTMIEWKASSVIYTISIFSFWVMARQVFTSNDQNIENLLLSPLWCCICGILPTA